MKTAASCFQHHSFCFSRVEQVHAHHKPIKGTLNKLLQADDIKLSWKESACIALVVQRLLPKAEKHFNKSTSQTEVGNKPWIIRLPDTLSGLTLDNLTTHVQTTLCHAVKAPPVTIFRYNGGLPVHFTSVLSFWKSCRGKLKKALQWWKAGTFVDMAGTDWQHFIFPFGHLSSELHDFGLITQTNTPGSHILFKSCGTMISQHVSL